MEAKMISVKAKPEFRKSLTKHMYNRMLQQKNVDVIFAVRDKSISAHMVVLSGCSEFFEENQYQLSDIFSTFDDTVIDAMLKYCYTGEINIDETRLDKFIDFANMLQIKDIVITPDASGNKVDLSNYLNTLKLSNNPTAIKNATKLAAENFTTMYKTPDYLGLQASTVAEILKSKNLNVPSQEEVFNAVKLWVDFDDIQRRTYLLELLNSMRLTLLTLEFLTTKVLPYCHSSPECISVVNGAVQSISPTSPNNSRQMEQVKLALVGSWDDPQNTIDVYDPVQNIWRQSKDFDLNRIKFASALVNDWILIIGGLSNNKPVTTVEYVNLKDGQKYQLRPLNKKRSGLAAVALKQVASTDVYAIGGDDGRNPMNSVERWNSKRQIWETNLPALLLPVAEHGASVIDGKIYVTGGSTYVKRSFQSTNQVQMYSPATNSWSYRAPMLQKRFLHMSSAINGKLYVVGGINDPYSSQSYMNSVESYDPNANLWTRFCTLQNPQSGTSLTFLENKYLFIGGNDGTNTNRNVLEYDDANKQWKSLKSLSVNRNGAQSFLIPYDSII